MLGREGEYSNAVVWIICQEETGIHVHMYLIADFGPGRRGDSHDVGLTIIHDRMGKEFLSCIADYMSGRDSTLHDIQ
jgi:hypothetical protein